MQSILFLKELRKKGTNYSDIWLRLLLELDLGKSQNLKLNAPKGISRTTYKRIIDFGVEIFPNYITSMSIKKNRELLIVEVATKIEKTEKPIFVLKKESPKVIEKEVKVEPITIVKAKVQKNPIEAKIPIEVYESIIGYLNECTGQSYKANSKANQTFINARIKDGYNLDDFRKVIFIKSTKWLNTKMQDFLRPQTLFSNKFEAYLNESIIIEPTKQQINYDNAIEATKLGWNTSS